MKKIILFMVSLMVTIAGVAQPLNPYNLVIYGNVSTISNGNPVKNHLVMVKRLSSGTALYQESYTDNQGNYRIEILNGSVTGPNQEYKVFTYGCDSTIYATTVSNMQGTVDQKEVNFKICEAEEPGCLAYFSYQFSTNNANRVIFTNQSPRREVAGMNFIWTFGDGSEPVTTKNAEHTFPGQGSYQVCLVSLFNNCTDTICKTVVIGNVQAPCNPEFTFEDFKKAPAVIEFHAAQEPSGSNNNHSWVINHDTIYHNANPVYTFSHSGEYQVCHRIINTATNCEKTLCKTVHILPADTIACKAYFSITPSTAAPNRFVFHNQSIGIQPEAGNFKWSFGDGTPAALSFNAEHTYSTPGTYTVCLHISGNGCEDHFCKTIVVQAPPNSCNADYQWNRMSNESPYKVAFHSLPSPSAGINHLWKFNGANQSELPNPVFNFPGPGTYTVCHILYTPAGMCRDTVCKQIVLLPPPNDTLDCKAKFIWFSAESNAQKVIFKNQSAPGQYSWSFGDSTFSSEANPTHTYSAPGQYQVCLKVQRGACSDKYCMDVNVIFGNDTGFTIGGRVFAGAHNADIAKVNLIRRDPVSQALYVFKTTFVDSAGSYSFTHIPSGIYLIRAGLLPASAYFSHYVPTYFGSHYYWRFAEPVIINADCDSYNIALIYGHHNGGPGGIGGGITGPIRMDGPISEATVIVTNLQDIPQRWAVTDNYGQFSINDLAYGTYRLWADHQGMECIPVEFTLSEENPQVNYSLQMSSEITLISDIQQDIFGAELYPNPANSLVSLNLTTQKPASLEVQVTRITGQSVMQKIVNIGVGHQEVQIPVSDVAAGLYFVNIRDTSSGVLISSKKLTVVH